MNILSEFSVLRILSKFGLTALRSESTQRSISSAERQLKYRVLVGEVTCKERVVVIHVGQSRSLMRHKSQHWFCIGNEILQARYGGYWDSPGNSAPAPRCWGAGAWWWPHLRGGELRGYVRSCILNLVSCKIIMMVYNTNNSIWIKNWKLNKVYIVKTRC